MISPILGGAITGDEQGNDALMYQTAIDKRDAQVRRNGENFFSSTMNDYNDAMENMALLDSFERIVRGGKTSPSSIGNLANTLGLTETFPALIQPDVAKLNLLSKELNTKITKKMGSRVSRDVFFYLSSVMPNGNKSPKTNLALIDLLRKEMMVVEKKGEIAMQIKSRVPNISNEELNAVTNKVLKDIYTRELMEWTSENGASSDKEIREMVGDISRKIQKHGSII